jgi:hypothetical protein
MIQKVAHLHIHLTSQALITPYGGGIGDLKICVEGP